MRLSVCPLTALSSLQGQRGPIGLPGSSGEKGDRVSLKHRWSLLSVFMWKHAHLSSQGLPGFNGVPGPTGPPGAPVSLFVFFLNDTFIYINPLYTFYDFFFFSPRAQRESVDVRDCKEIRVTMWVVASCIYIKSYTYIHIIYSYTHIIADFFFLGCSGTKGWARKSRGKRRYCKWPVHIHWA